MYSFRFVIFVCIFQLIDCKAIHLDTESTTDTIRESTLSPNPSTNFKEIKNVQANSTILPRMNAKRDEIETKSQNFTDQTSATSLPELVADLIENSTDNKTKRLLEQDSNSMKNDSKQDKNNSIKIDSIQDVKNLIANDTMSDTSLRNFTNAEKKEDVSSLVDILPEKKNSSYKIVITDTSNNQTPTTEIVKTNQTLLFTIMLRMQSILQYSSNISSQAVIPYVYLAKIQIDNLYRQIADSTFLQNYASNAYQLIMNDLMNKECNIISTMANYVLVPAIQARGTSNAFMDRVYEFSDSVSRWHHALQRWSTHLSSTFNHVAELRFEDCGQKLLCSLGKAKYQSSREEQPRGYRTMIIKFLNNLFNMPMLEKRIKRNYLEARQLGAAGGDCESFNSSCAIASENFDALIDLIKQLFSTD